MKMFSNCSGECCVCANGGYCIAGHGDDDFAPASKERIIDNLNKGRYSNCTDYMIKYLVDKYNYIYNKKDWREEMRLINADEFAIEEPKLWDWDSVDGISSTTVLKQCIWDVQCASKVEAIPVEWIKKYIDSTLDEGNSQMLGFKAAIIKEMIEEWEKENEISVMPVSDNSTIPLDYLGERK